MAGNKNISGIDKRNKYRVIGDILRLSKQIDAGTVRTGLWYETSDTDRHQYDLDLTLGLRDPRETKPTPVQSPSVLFDQQSTIRNVQPFVQCEWALAPNTTLTPGVRYVQLTRAVDAAVNQTTRLPQHTSVDYRTTLPFLTVNQKLSNNLAMYAQYAKGFQIPDLKTFYIANPTSKRRPPGWLAAAWRCMRTVQGTRPLPTTAAKPSRVHRT